MQLNRGQAQLSHQVAVVRLKKESRSCCTELSGGEEWGLFTEEALISSEEAETCFAQPPDVKVCDGLAAPQVPEPCQAFNMKRKKNTKMKGFFLKMFPLSENHYY